MATIKYELEDFTEIAEHPLFEALNKCANDLERYINCAMKNHKQRHSCIQDMWINLHNATKLAGQEWQREWHGPEDWILESRKKPATSHR